VARSLSRSSLALVALLVGTSLMSAPAHADTEEARSHFTRAVELFKEADFRAALIEFQRAYDSAPNYKVLYNLGQTSLELQDYASALKAFRGYLDGGGREVPAARRAQVEADLKKLDSRVARVEIVVNVEGADVSIDEVPVGRSPLAEPVLASAGRRRIVATKSGFGSAMRTLDVAGGDRARVTLELAPPQTNTVVVTQPSEGGTTQTPPVTEPAKVVVRGGPSTAFWISLTTTGVLAVTAGVLGGVALVSKNDFDAKIAQVGVQTSQVDNARDQTRSFALATDIVGACAIAGAVTTLILAFTTSKKEAREVPRALNFIVGPGSIGISGVL
jgi:hypothetical protein